MTDSVKQKSQESEIVEVGSNVSDDKNVVKSAPHITEQVEAEVHHKVLGLDYYENSQEISKEEIEAEFPKIRRKLDFRILPLLCVTYTLQFLDKLSLNYASAYTFREDLGLEGQKYSWVAAIFNFGYLGGCIPANYLLQRVPVAKYTGCALVTWAIILVSHTGAKNYAGILVLRFILGVLEACISPNCMNICQLFYSTDDQPFRMFTFLSCNGIATIVGALLGYGLGHATEAAIPQWQLIFLVIGLLNFVWAAVFLAVCPDSPAHAKFLSDRQKSVLIAVVSKNNQGLKDKRYKVPHILEAFQDVSVWMLEFIGLGCGVINGGVSNFSSSLIEGYGFSGLMSTALQLPTGAIEFVVVFGFGVLALFVKNTRCISLFFVNAIPLAGLIGIKLTPVEDKWALVGCTWLQFIVGGPVIISWILLNANVGGSSKKTMANALWFFFYAGGNIIGANIFFAREAPKYPSAMNGLITCYCLMIGLGISYGFLMNWRNRKRNEIQGEYTEEIRQEAIINGFKDMTDFQNIGFRYSW